MNTSEKYNESFIELAAALQALAHPARLQIVEHLAKYHECPAGAISSELPLSKSTVSQHMAKLREAGLISCSPAGICQNYKLNENRLNEVIQQMESFGDAVNLLAKEKIRCKNSINKAQLETVKSFQLTE
ncbi:DNA-binding transcriptional regulator, ArsR family [Tangfeifania diversioriginum]|uniref:DNA-binding transcriptional regulator, ArsR family n=1 Tax=Tangfeifania diversioriginum TaxID=1168035 RepID=A0A1M6C8D7_9BACT|nr:metalloregulator ArsR/SmtB family transcription factor [Tangfeifania diversioriginum]SHI57024.1 DNA-binding transcriptional regulator, ArsR family [Tangfeifania diversioriginum]